MKGLHPQSRTASVRGVAEHCLCHLTSSGAKGAAALIGGRCGTAFANFEIPD